MPTHKLLFIQEGHLAAMAGNSKITSEFPFLAKLNAVKQGGCRSCGGGSSNPQRAAVIQAAKATIAGMGDEQKRKLKALLDARQIRIEYRDNRGRAIRYTF